MKLYLDDYRKPPRGWTVARSAQEAKKLLATREVTEMSFDYDLDHSCKKDCWLHDKGIAPLKRLCKEGCKCGCHETGLDVVKWMIHNNHWPQKKPAVHSANPLGHAAMSQLIDNHWQE
jgi:hypothetical protein